VKQYTPAEIQGLIAFECVSLRDMLLEKNRKYGNSALEPRRIFARGIDTEAQIRVRLDDKLSRLASAQGDEDEDVIQDLLGYLILLRVAKRMAAEDTCAPK